MPILDKKTSAEGVSVSGEIVCLRNPSTMLLQWATAYTQLSHAVRYHVV